MSPIQSETAQKIFQEKGYNCSQAIFTAYGEQLGSGKVDYDTCLKIASAFGGGIARTGNVCGALTGALMVLGLKYGGPERKDQEKVNEIAGKFLNEFKSLNGSIICRELIEYDLTTITPSEIEEAFKKGTFNKCPKFVEDVSMILEKMI